MDLLTAATQLFRQCLAHPGNAGALYLAGATGERRPVSPAVQASALLGWAPHGYTQQLAAWRYSWEDMQAAGLVDVNFAEVYGDRLTFPWLDMSGRHIVGLGGRAVPTRRPKYVNTPEPLFTKGSSVFGLAQAARSIHALGWAIITEGPFDALALWELGWPNAVATVGAKVTADQLAMVLRLTDTAVVLLDADEGGKRGREALATMLQRQPWPAPARILTATLAGTKDAGDPATTSTDVADALQASIPLAHI